MAAEACLLERAPANADRAAGTLSLRTDIRDQETLECREVARSACSQHHFKEALLLRRTRGDARMARHLITRSGDKLPHVCFFHAKDVGNLAVGIVERLSKHVRGALTR